MKATTDSLKEIKFDENRPGIFNLLSIYQSFTNIPVKEIEAKFEGKGYGDFKKELAEVVVEGLRPLQERYYQITSESGYIDSVVKAGAEKVRPTAQKTLGRVQERIGLG